MHQEYKTIEETFNLKRLDPNKFNVPKFQDEHSELIANTIIRRSRYEIGIVDIFKMEMRKFLCCFRKYRRDNVIADQKI